MTDNSDEEFINKAIHEYCNRYSNAIDEIWKSHYVTVQQFLWEKWTNENECEFYSSKYLGNTDRSLHEFANWINSQ